MLKKYKVVMLPTEKAINKDSICTRAGKLAFSFDEPLTLKNWKRIELFITSDDEIKVGDYFLADNRMTTTQNEGNPKWVLCICTKVSDTGWIYCNEFPEQGFNGDWCKKVIACTDKSTNLPRPSEGFLFKLITEHNKGIKIDEVMVEYCILFNQPPDTGDHSIGEYLKINPKDNTITIKKVKDSYTREEVYNLISEFADYCDGLYRPYTRDNMEAFYAKDKWLEEKI